MELGFSTMLTEGEQNDKIRKQMAEYASQGEDRDIIPAGSMNGQGQPAPDMYYNDTQDVSSAESQNSQSDTQGQGFIPLRKRRAFMPDNRKDNSYWEKRKKNNEAARRSREKRRIHDLHLDSKVYEISQQNALLKQELAALKKKYAIPTSQQFVGTDDENEYDSDPTAGISSSHHAIGHAPPMRMVSPGAAPHASMMPSNNRAMYSSPPPLLAVTGAIPGVIPGRGLPGANYPGTNPIPYYLVPSASEQHGLHAERQKAQSGMYNGSPPMQIPGEKISNVSNVHSFENTPVKTEPPDPATGDSAGPPPLMPRTTSSPTISSASYYLPQNQKPDAESRMKSWDNSTNSYSSDEQDDEPLQLTVKKENGSAAHNDKPRSRSPTCSSLPLKLRHKEMFAPMDSSHSYSSHRPFMDGLAQLSEIALAQANPGQMVRKDSFSSQDAPCHPDRDLYPRDLDSSMYGSLDASGEPKYLDPKYLERRRRNNEAARKCRENRKALTRLREVKSDYLESENNKLRNEMEGLQEEMKQLRELLEKKRLEKGMEDSPTSET
ncbi:uncharacterized protein LOC121374099 isoform X2 [Gigantopelta aegis]|nr:uncharacterized protein LOC121374099 isoform X2 [Gigantopelta aegis]